MCESAVAEPSAEQLARWREQQERLRQRCLIVHDQHDFGPDLAGLHRVGGVDISTSQHDPTEAYAALVVLTFPALDLLHCAVEPVRLTRPYLPGFLAYREAAPLAGLLQRLRTTAPACFPQVVLVDGNGVFHPSGAPDPGAAPEHAGTHGRPRQGSDWPATSAFWPTSRPSASASRCCGWTASRHTASGSSSAPAPWRIRATGCRWSARPAGG